MTAASAAISHRLIQTVNFDQGYADVATDTADDGSVATRNQSSEDSRFEIVRRLQSRSDDCCLLSAAPIIVGADRGTVHIEERQCWVQQRVGDVKGRISQARADRTHQHIL